MFEAADRDGSQSLSIYDYKYVLHKDFEMTDHNRDGTIDIEELELLVNK